MKKAVDDPPKQGANDTLWFCGIPIKTGPGNTYSRNLIQWMHIIVVFQAIACGAKIVILREYIGAIWMCAVVAVGYYAMHQDMNITFICLWGILCMINGIFDLIGLVLPFIISLVRLNVLHLIAGVASPLSYLLGAVFAVHLYQVSADDDDVRPLIPEGQFVQQVGDFFDNTDPFS